MLAELQRELLRYGAAGCALLLMLAAAFHPLEGTLFALRFLLLGVACWLYVCWQCWKLLALNSPDHQTALYPHLGHANRLTLLRALLIACTAGFLFNDFSHALIGFVPAMLYTIAAICDRVDGYLARRQKQVTQLGTELDTIIDALGLVVAPLLAVLYGKAHVSYLLVSIAWYLFSWGLHWRRRHNKPTYPLLPSKLRRTMAGFQMGFVAGALWPPLDPRMTQLFGVAFMVPLLAGFCVDWLVVSGRINTRTRHAVEGLLLMGSLTQRYVMPVMRFALAALLLLAMSEQKIVTSPFDLFAELPVTRDPAVSVSPSPGTWLFVAGITFLLCMLGIITGFFGRASATTLMLLLCWVFPFTVFDTITLLAIACTVLIILLGTGRHSLLNADEAWINRQDGA